MKKKLKLVSEVPCSVNHYIKPRPFIMYGKPQVTMYETAEAKSYKKNFAKYIKEQVKLQGFNIEVNKTQHFYVDCVFYFDRIDKDANNYFKLLLDSITDSKCIWEDDNVVCERVNAIYYDAKNPRIEIEIYPVDYIGIFDNQEQLDVFTESCICCKRYKEGKCSIYKKALEGRIQEEINNGICLKASNKN
jgi:Holliday junction resolvase RusA-like endonuclease